MPHVPPPPKMPPTPWLTVYEAAEYMRFGPASSVLAIVETGELVPDGRAGTGGGYLFRTETLDRYLAGLVHRMRKESTRQGGRAKPREAPAPPSTPVPMAEPVVPALPMKARRRTWVDPGKKASVVVAFQQSMWAAVERGRAIRRATSPALVERGPTRSGYWDAVAKAYRRALVAAIQESQTVRNAWKRKQGQWMPSEDRLPRVRPSAFGSRERVVVTREDDKAFLGRSFRELMRAAVAGTLGELRPLPRRGRK